MLTNNRRPYFIEGEIFTLYGSERRISFSGVFISSIVKNAKYIGSSSYLYSGLIEYIDFYLCDNIIFVAYLYRESRGEVKFLNIASVGHLWWLSNCVNNFCKKKNISFCKESGKIQYLGE